MSGIDAKKGYDVWLKVIADEELYEAVLAKTHAEAAKKRGFDAEQVAALDELSNLPGTRWNIENLRYRCTGEVAAIVQNYLPRTVRMLTRGITEWYQDLIYEYLAHYKWQVFGQLRIAECERFAEYVQKRIVLRRRPPDHLDAVMGFELAVARLIRKTATVAPDAWPKIVEPPADDDVLLDLIVKRGPVVETIDIPVDITEWIRSADPLTGSVGDEPITMLAFIPSLLDPYRLTKLNEATKMVFEKITGDKTTAALVEEVESALEIEPEQTVALVRRWIKDRVLVI